jgi:hypothetical protein
MLPALEFYNGKLKAENRRLKISHHKKLPQLKNTIDFIQISPTEHEKTHL